METRFWFAFHLPVMGVFFYRKDIILCYLTFYLLPIYSNALKCYSRARDYCISAKQVVNMCVNVIKVGAWPVVLTSQDIFQVSK